MDTEQRFTVVIQSIAFFTIFASVALLLCPGAVLGGLWTMWL